MSMRCTVTAESGGLGLFAGRTRLQPTMKTLIIIFALDYCILGAAGNFYPWLGKCCRYGQVISLSKNFTCSFGGTASPVMYQLRGRRGCGTFLARPKTKSLNSTRLENVTERIVRPNVACMDMIYDAEKHESHPGIIPCPRNTSSEVDAKIKTVRGTTFPILRMCCGIDRVYDVGKRDCVLKTDGLNVPSNFKFLKENLQFVIAIRGAPTCKEAILDYVVNVTRDLRVLDDGRLEVVLVTKDGPQTIIMAENNTCLDSGNSGTSGLVAIRTCSQTKYCDKHPCVRKCCPEDQAIISAARFKLKCGKIPPDVPPGHFHSILHNVSVKLGLGRDMKALESSDYGMLFGVPCSKETSLHPVERYERWHITPRGYIYLTQYKIFSHDIYCVELYLGNAREKDTIYPVVCLNNPKSLGDETASNELRVSLNSISCFFLIVTLLVYICLPRLRNLHGITLMCYVVSLAITSACYASSLVIIPSAGGTPDSEGTICKFFGFMTLFSNMASSSWLNVMCFDMWWTLGGLGGVATSRAPGFAYKKRFVMYSLYAWGVALLITCIAVIVDTTKFLTDYLRPNMSGTYCWFYPSTDFNGEVIYLLGPEFIQQIANVIFFVLTARYCSRVKAEINRVMASPTDLRSQRYKATRTKYIMNIKLFIVMDITWIFSTTHHFFSRYNVALSWSPQFVYLSHMYKGLRGVLIFILFVLKRTIYYELLRRLGLGTTSNAVPVRNTGATAVHIELR